MKTVVKSLRRVTSIRCANALLTAAAVAAVALPANTAPFRQIQSLPMIPPSITFPSERQILKTDRDRLAARQIVVRRLQVDYSRDCLERHSVSATLRRHCSFRLQEIHRQLSRLDRDIDALRVRFRTVAENALRRRHRGAGQRQVPAPGRGDDPRLAIINDTLESAGSDWQSVLEKVRTAAAGAAGNPALRDVAAYLTGVYEGDIAADILENPYYKHGVRRWLAGDRWSAALAFARAARDNPGDDRVFASFAAAAGRQHAGPSCVRARRCVSGNIAVWAGRFGKAHKREVDNLLNRYRRNPDAGSMTPMRNLLGAIAIYAEKTEPQGELTRGVAGRAQDVLAKLRGGDPAGAFVGYVGIWRSASPRRADIFARHYMNAGGAQTFRRFPDWKPAVVGTRMNADAAYLSRLRRVLRDSPDGNPFAGALTQAQIIRLQR